MVMHCDLTSMLHLSTVLTLTYKPFVAAVKKSNDLATFVEARLGKPSHLLEGDRLKQFLAQSGKVGGWQLAPSPVLQVLWAL